MTGILVLTGLLLLSMMIGFSILSFIRNLEEDMKSVEDNRF